MIFLNQEVHVTFIISLIKSLPFLLPFFKEVFLSDKEGKSKYCIRVYVIGVLSIIGVSIMGKSFYDYIFAVNARNQVLEVELTKLEDFRNHLMESNENMRTRNKRQYQAYLLLNKSYSELRDDYKDLKFEYDKLFRFILHGVDKISVDEMALIKEEHQQASDKFEENSKMIIDNTIFKDLEQTDVPVKPPPVIRNPAKQ